MTTNNIKNYKHATNQPNQKQDGPGEQPSEGHQKQRAGGKGSDRGDHRGQAASDNRLDTTKEAGRHRAETDEQYDDDDFGQANDVSAAARDDDEGSHEAGQSRGSMSSDRGLRAAHSHKRSSVSEQEENAVRRPESQESKQTTKGR